jgi:predicted esterase YcpF (UPF0227 family)
MLIYLHGFRSSPSSFKARWLQERMHALGLAAEFFCPALPVSPKAAIAQILKDCAPTASDTLVGSSLGGCYATHLAEQLGCRAVLLNPSTRPSASLSKYLGVQTQYHDPTTTFVLEPHHLEELANLQTQRITRPERYFLIAATGDEVLNWRDMVAFYQGARHHVIEGSDHGLSDFADYADEVLRFAGYLPA